MFVNTFLKSVWPIGLALNVKVVRSGFGLAGLVCSEDPRVVSSTPPPSKSPG
jgi:hypothetical protein